MKKDMNKVRVRDFEPNNHAGGQQLPPLGVITAQQVTKFGVARESMEFTINEGLEGYAEARAAREYGTAISLLEAAAAAALRWADVVGQQVKIEHEAPKEDFKAKIDVDVVHEALEIAARSAKLLDVVAEMTTSRDDFYPLGSGQFRHKPTGWTVQMFDYLELLARFGWLTEGDEMDWSAARRVRGLPVPDAGESTTTWWGR